MNKKTFTDIDPIMQFITTSKNKQNNDRKISFHSKENNKIKDTRKNKEEIKSKRLNLLLRPNILKDIKVLANIKTTSVNDIINIALSEYTARNKENIEKYVELMKQIKLKEE